jgi:hypothetical protein
MDEIWRVGRADTPDTPHLAGCMCRPRLTRERLGPVASRKSFESEFWMASRMRTSISMTCAISSYGWVLKSALAAATTSSEGTASET